MLPRKNIDRIIYKSIGENTRQRSRISDSTRQKLDYADLKSLRQEYEFKRPRLLFLADHDPGSEEYKQLRSECQDIFQVVESITLDRS